MSRVRNVSRWGAGALALVLAGGVGSAAALPQDPGATAADEGTVVLSNDFEGADVAPWGPRGPVTLAVTADDARSGAQSMLVSGRTGDWNGPATDALALMTGGTTYDVSAWVKLAPGTAGESAVHITVDAPAAANPYEWVGGAVTVTADEWVEVGGTYTPAAGLPAASLYLEAAPIDGAHPSFLVDDVRIATAGGVVVEPGFVPGGAVNPSATPVAAAQGEGDVAALTFDDGPNPGETDELLDYLAENDLPAVFCVIGQNITAPGGAELLRRIVDEGHTLCNHTTGYADMGSWTAEQVQADLVENLAIIREALGDPEATVPYFRAPNGSWGVTPQVAVALGMQPLAVTGTIDDWTTQDVPTLTANLRAAMVPGRVVLAHDGGGPDRTGTVAAVRTVVSERLAEGWSFTLPVGGLSPLPGDGGGGQVVLIDSDFEETLEPWTARGADGAPQVSLSPDAHESTQAALVEGRTQSWHGLATDVTSLFATGTTYQISAWVKLAAGEAPTDLRISVQRDTDGASAYDTVATATGVTAGAWVQVQAAYTMTAADSALLYVESASGTPSFLVDDVLVTAQAPSDVQDLTPIKDTVPFPMGVAIDQRETVGGAAELLTRHFDQITGENHMKPEAWYDEDRTFRLHPEAAALMEFAQENDLRVYGHVLVWHSQTPEWFFQDAAGAPLPADEAGKQELRERLRTHVFAVAESLSSEYGLFGSAENPLVAWDVVNEVVADGREFEDGLRRSEWYRILGEEFIDLAFEYADEAFNDVYAAPGTDRPVTLFINDYNTEQDGKQQRYHALVERLLARGVPIDGVGHQFHTSLATPVSALDAALDAFEDLGLIQVVTELDVTVGTPVTQANLVEQGYYYRDAFRIFREHAEDLYSVTIWGLTDDRSWRTEQAPLAFDAQLQAKPAYYGAVDGDLPAQVRAAFVFAGDVPLDGAATASPEWDRLPLHDVGEAAQFQLRWAPDHLTAYVSVTDASVDPTDGLTFVVGDAAYSFARDGSGDVQGIVTPTDTGWEAVVHLPVTAAQGDTVGFDVQVTDGATTTGWNTPGALGALTLVEPLSFLEVAEAPVAPTVDGAVDEVWALSEPVTTDTVIEGDGTGATASVRTLWSGDGSTLHVLAEVTDPQLDATSSDPWVQDSVEIFVDAGNVRNGPYRADDTQIRISYLNEVSFGTGDQAAQDARLESATSVTETGYLVEASISLLDAGGPGTFHGLDFQVNDGTAGTRTSVRTWAEPNGAGYQTNARWGVGQLVEADVVEPPVLDPRLRVDELIVAAGNRLPVAVTGYAPGTTVELRLETWPPGRRGTSVLLGAVTVGADGTGSAVVTVPRTTKVGIYSVAGTQGDLRASDEIVVVPPKPAWWPFPWF
ncbi:MULTISPECIES: endo-1,4-beta-xylanase [unclassified Actinotalea]|uniref:endo-1,4-beta-xylanase n=1 Tax=unclassified Actinotalea TaxID=2638618 RepID=UPI0015F565B7|nr:MULTISPECIES: endo-1,4-beta-xylanase [unclassified Actinotalea]